uniref:Putative secreted protein n=1 Tax=Panstrongylus lignarius TaxID=156445 RepID=A0A224XK91_9HEMI
MMKHFLILLAASVLAQGLKEEEVISRNPTEKNAEDLLRPLMKEYFELKNLIEEVKQHQQTQRMSSLVLAERLARVPPNCLPTETLFIEAWSPDDCNNLTKTLAKAADLANRVMGWGFKAGLNMAEKFFDVLRCANINPFTAIKCIIKDVNDLKEIAKGYKPEVLKIKEDIIAQCKELKLDFNQCFGIQKQAEAAAEQIVVQAQLCDHTRL